MVAEDFEHIFLNSEYIFQNDQEDPDKFCVTLMVNTLLEPEYYRENKVSTMAANYIATQGAAMVWTISIGFGDNTDLLWWK